MAPVSIASIFSILVEHSHLCGEATSDTLQLTMAGMWPNQTACKHTWTEQGTWVLKTMSLLQSVPRQLTHHWCPQLLENLDLGCMSTNLVAWFVITQNWSCVSSRSHLRSITWGRNPEFSLREGQHPVASTSRVSFSLRCKVLPVLCWGDN